MGIQISFCDTDLISLWYIPRSVIAGSHNTSIFSFFEASLFLIVAVPIYNPTSSIQWFPFFRFSPALISCLFDYACLVASVVYNSLQLYGPYPNRLLCSLDFPGKNTRMGCHALLQGIFLTQGLHLHLLNCKWILHCWAMGESPFLIIAILSVREISIVV